ncbi:ABC transporter permease [Pinirhizobacter sp.]|jgi:phospholipid/cholesterol/gamma-HCH transport system permease protein|uniref:ABC transporter permease n=1 Tax=Pinirhizobacter sp. TaxID=2950432 RepID=UPI002F41F9DD
MATEGTPGTASIDVSSGTGRLVVAGDWTLPYYATLHAHMRICCDQVSDHTAVDFSGLGALDTAGASLLADLLGPARVARLAAGTGLPDARAALLQTVGNALAAYCKPARPRRSKGLEDFLAQIGAGVESFGKQTLKLLGFVGIVFEALGRTFWRPKRWRVTSLVSHIEQTGLNALPIVALLSFMVGAVVAFLGATVLADFGATIFTVDLVAYAFLREFGVILTAILLAGRTASAFTAQIGSMKAREEIDAIRTLGLDPVELLVLPRVLALLVALPLLTFIAMMAGVIGGAVVCYATLGITPTMFINLFHEDIHLRQFLVGIAKAPFFAFLIAVIGCMEGFKVAGSAQSVGEHTTSAVVQSIFVVILFDAIAALFYTGMGW